ncbi:MAG: peptide chain release factor 1 [Flavobacteriales bacterium]|jgi:peptide chain release factor 1|nr:peptide chain release factor 1 [Flavobacteriales bacterium]MBQ1969090.1 peptide chain release factor 1 [Flavobacteriales bacterium]
MATSLLEKLEGLKTRFDEVSDLIIQPDVIADQKRYMDLGRQYKQLEKIMEVYKRYKTALDNIEEAREIIREGGDAEMVEMARMQLEESEPQIEPLEEEIKYLLIPRDPEDAKNAMVELRGGTGGDEAAIFAGDLYRMYSKYAESKGWRLEVMDFNEGTSGGYKEMIFKLSGDDVYGTMKFEAGVHRVQRVPATETQGRVHTSAATCIVMPEAEEFDIYIDPKDIRKDTFCSSGAGGQSVNTTYSAVRLTHIPTGIVAQCQDERSQLKNLEKCMTVLRSRLYEIEFQKRLEEDAKRRKSMVSSGDRSAKIRTYNYPQGRVTDHRIGLTLYNLADIMGGDIQKIIDELTIAENAEKLKDME